MSTDKPKPPADPDLPPAPGGPPLPGSRSCLFTGCVVLAAVAVVLTLAVGVGVFVLYRYSGRLVEDYTATAPVPIPIVRLPEAQTEEVEQRIHDFEDRAEAGNSATVTLSEEEINALIARESDLAGKVAIKLEGGRIRAVVSIPLEILELPVQFLGGLKGRYLNGTAVIKPRFEGREIAFDVSELEVRGRKAPQRVLDALGKDGVVRFDLGDHGEISSERIERFDVGEGKISITLRQDRPDAEQPPAPAPPALPLPPPAAP